MLFRSIGEDEIKQYSQSKGPMSYVRRNAVIAGHDAIQIARHGQHRGPESHIGNEISPNDRQIRDCAGRPHKFQRCEKDRPAKKQQLEEDER